MRNSQVFLMSGHRALDLGRGPCFSEDIRSGPKVVVIDISTGS